jgi:hypothetical protein
MILIQETYDRTGVQDLFHPFFDLADVDQHSVGRVDTPQ